jgi:hypothetical protein
VLLFALALPLPILAEFDAGYNVIGRWTGPTDLTHVQLLQQGGWTTVLLPWPGNEGTEAFADAAGRAGITAIAELDVVESVETARQAVASAREVGFDGVAVTARGAFGSADVLRDFVKDLRGFDVLVFLDRDQISSDVSGAHPILTSGLWPGVRAPPNVPGRGIEVASASREPWLDTNPYLIGYLRGMFPERTAVLGYRPDAAAGITGGRAVPNESLEVALVEAFMAGGNFVISVPDDYRMALLSGDKEALIAWKSLGSTARFLQENRDKIQRPNRSRVAAAAGSLAESGEILNLMYRRNMFPVVHPVSDIPVIDPSRFRAFVYANLAAPGPAPLRRIFGYVTAGGLLVVSPRDRETPPWWIEEGAEKVRSDADRDHYTLGNGRIVAYHDAVLDPSEFALDVIDLVGVQTRDVRLWNAPTVVGSAVEADRIGAQIHLVNYDTPIERGFPARVDGVFRRATVLEPNGQARSLKAVKRGDATEVWVDRIGRLALIQLR